MSAADAPATIALHGRDSSLVLESNGAGAPFWRHWGARIGAGTLAGPGLRATRGLPSFTLDAHLPLTVAPTFGLGWFGLSAVLAHRGGRDFSHQFTHCELALEHAANALRIGLRDEVAGLALEIVLCLDQRSDVLSIRSRLTNTGRDPLEVQWLASGTLPLPTEAREIRHYTGLHNQELCLQRARLGHAQWRLENRHGLTSHEAFPGAVVTTAGATDDAGECYGAQLAWSGNHAQAIEWLEDGRFQWQLGELAAPGELILAPGEALAAPEVLATFSAAGLSGIARNFHAAARLRSRPHGESLAARPIHLNTWEGFYFDHDVPTLKSLATRAAALGIERFVLDDGWFHRRDDDRRGLGDWWPDARKYPDGLEPVAAHVVALGMQFGLWVEPEMVNPDSELFRAHPQWALQIEGRPMLTARHQLVLDLTHPGVIDYLFERLDRLLGELPVAYLKWDHNRHLAPVADAEGRPCYHRQVASAYALLDRIRAAHPAVEIEACAGGGGRMDAGILSRVQRFWTSDCLDPAVRVRIQQGFLQFFPPELMGSHIGASPAHSTGRLHTLDFRAAVALPGHLGIELDPRSLSDSETERLRFWLQRYKDLRAGIHGGDFWQGVLPDGLCWQAFAHAQASVLFLYRLEPSEQRYPPMLRLSFVDPGASYEVRRLDHDEATMSFEGSWLNAVGLPTPRLLPASAAIFLIEAA